MQLNELMVPATILGRRSSESGLVEVPSGVRDTVQTEEKDRLR